MEKRPFCAPTKSENGLGKKEHLSTTVSFKIGGEGVSEGRGKEPNKTSDRNWRGGEKAKGPPLKKTKKNKEKAPKRTVHYGCRKRWNGNEGWGRILKSPGG